MFTYLFLTPPILATRSAPFGEPAGGASGASANATVPEPATLVLMILPAAGACLRRIVLNMECQNTAARETLHQPTELDTPLTATVVPKR